MAGNQTDQGTASGRFGFVDFQLPVQISIKSNLTHCLSTLPPLGRRARKEEHVRKSSVRRDPIPRHLKSVEEAAEFCDNHDPSDYWELRQEADFQVDIQRRAFLTALEPEFGEEAYRLRSQTGCVY